MTRRDVVSCWAVVGVLVLLVLYCAAMIADAGPDMWREYRAEQRQKEG